MEEAISIRAKNTDLTLSSDIDPAIFIDGERAHDGPVGQGIDLPPGAVITDQALVIGKIHQAISVLFDIPGLGAAMEICFSIVDDQGKTDSILPFNATAKSEKNDPKEQEFHDIKIILLYEVVL